jgi:hypothetical protein
LAVLQYVSRRLDLTCELVAKVLAGILDMVENHEERTITVGHQAGDSPAVALEPRRPDVALQTGDDQLDCGASVEIGIVALELPDLPHALRLP